MHCTQGLQAPTWIVRSREIGAGDGVRTRDIQLGKRARLGGAARSKSRNCRDVSAVSRLLQRVASGGRRTRPEAVVLRVVRCATQYRRRRSSGRTSTTWSAARYSKFLSRAAANSRNSTGPFIADARPGDPRSPQDRGPAPCRQKSEPRTRTLRHQLRSPALGVSRRRTVPCCPLNRAMRSTTVRTASAEVAAPNTRSSGSFGYRTRSSTR